MDVESNWQSQSQIPRTYKIKYIRNAASNRYYRQNYINTSAVAHTQKIPTILNIPLFEIC